MPVKPNLLQPVIAAEFHKIKCGTGAQPINPEYPVRILLDYGRREVRIIETLLAFSAHSWHLKNSLKIHLKIIKRLEKLEKRKKAP